MAGALLVADQDVAHRRLPDRVVGGEDGPAGKAEHDLDVAGFQAPDERLGAGELHGCSQVRVVLSGRGKKNLLP